MSGTKKRMTKEEKEQWDMLYEYVRTNVLGYDSNQSLSRGTALRLKGLLTNKFMENYKVKDSANYSYIVILNTFKYCNPDIQKKLMSTSFKDENHKINYILKIVEANINTVYNRMKNANKVNKDIEQLNIELVCTEQSTYKKRTEDKRKNKYSDLW